MKQAAVGDRSTSTPSTLLDRTSRWLVTLVLAATASVGVQAIWWSWHPLTALTERSPWTTLYLAVSFLARRFSWSPAIWIAGTAVMALAAVGVALRRSWGSLLAIPSAAVLVSCALVVRSIAVVSEPPQYVARSPYVRAATVIALITVIGHGLVMLLATRALYRRGDPTRSTRALTRLLLAGSALLLAGLPVLWLRMELPGGGRNAAMICGCAAAVLAALVAAVLPLRRSVLASLGVSTLAVLGLVAGWILQLQDKPRRGRLYSADAEQAMLEVMVAAPLLLALLGLGIVMLRQLAAARTAAASRPGPQSPVLSPSS